MLKKAAVLSSLNGSQFHPGVISTTSPFILPQPRARPVSQRQWRSYAEVRHDLSWPSTEKPTPYEIFHLDRDDVYSKRTFYELVKLYHPDRHGRTDSHNGGLSRATKLERYRLVILAHEILSDPVKKRQYDQTGVGWLDRNERWARSTGARSGGPFGFGAGSDASPFGNATWEDWERWRTRRQGQSSQAYEGNYISPNGFASLVILMAVISGFAQATRTERYSTNLEEKMRNISAENSNFMQTRAEETNDLQHDGRIKQFLEKRDFRKLGLKEGEEESYGRAFHGHLPEPSKDDSITTSER